MNKPTKRTMRESDPLHRMYDKGFNHGIADMEAYYLERDLSIEEIEELINKYFIFERKFDWLKQNRYGRKVILDSTDSKGIAKAIISATIKKRGEK